MSTHLWIAFSILSGIAFASSAMGESGPLLIEKIECEGNQKTSCDYIIAQTQLHEGELVEDEKVKESRLRLELLGFFDDVNIQLSKGSSVGKTKMTISVKEREGYFYHASLTGGFNSYNGRVYTPTIGDLTGTKQNLSGHGDTLSLRFRTKQGSYTYQEYLGRMEYTRPVESLPKAYFSLGLATGKIAINQDICAACVVQNTFNVWTDIALGYKLFDFGFATAGYRYFARYNSPSVFMQMGWDSQDNAIFPTRGTRAILTTDLNGSPYYRSNDFSFGHASLSLSYLTHFKLAEKHILSLKLGGYQRGTDQAFYLSEEGTNTLKYSYQFTRHSISSFIKNGDFFIEPGLYFIVNSYYVNDHFGYSRPRIRVGSNLETKYGVINLSLIGQWD